ncbi:MAG: glycosyltransferase family A protein [Synechococcus sp.]
MNYTVVIPFYNNDQEIGIAIDSVLSQSIPPKQIYVVNDNSCLAATALLKSIVSEKNVDLVTIISHDINQGVSNARNSGIKASLNLGVDFIAFCDADDAWLMHKMKLQLPLFCHSNVLAVSCGLKGAAVPSAMQPGRLYSLTLKDFLRRNYIQPSTLVVRASALKLVGFFPKGRRYAEEGDLYNRIAENGSILYLAIPLVDYDTRDLLPVCNSKKDKGRPARLSHSILLMYLGNILNLYACFRRGSLSVFLLIYYTFLVLLRFVARCLRISLSKIGFPL